METISLGLMAASLIVIFIVDANQKRRNYLNKNK